MSIQTEIDRLIAAKEGIKTAIEEKGVDVPPEAKLEEYSDLIRSIPSGGNAVETIIEDTITEEIAVYTKNLDDEQIEKLNGAKSICLLMKIPKDSTINGLFKFGIYRPSWYGYYKTAHNGNINASIKEIYALYTEFDRKMKTTGFYNGYLISGVSSSIKYNASITASVKYEKNDCIKAEYANLPIGTQIFLQIEN